MPISGSLDEASLADLLQWLSAGRITGRLTISEEPNRGHIFLDSGTISGAFLANKRHRLGDLLFKRGHVTREQLLEASRIQERNPKKRFGEILVETGAITEAALGQFMRIQVAWTVLFMFTWRRGTFSFEQDVKQEDDDIVVSIDPEQLLINAAKRVDEWGVIEKKIPSFNMVFRTHRDRIEASDVELSDDLRLVAGLLDGRRNVTGVVAESGMTQFEAGKALFALISAGFAERVDRTWQPVPAVRPGGQSHDRRSGGDRRKKVIPNYKPDRRVHGAGDRRLATRAAATHWRTPERRRRSGTGPWKLAAVAVAAMGLGWAGAWFLGARSEDRDQSALNTEGAAADVLLGASDSVLDEGVATTDSAFPSDTTPLPAVAALEPDSATPVAPPEPATAQPVPEPARTQPVAAEQRVQREVEVSVPEPTPAPVDPVDQAGTPESVATTATILGTVRASGTGAPLSGARVSIADPEWSSTTGETGYFSFEGLPAGSLAVSVHLAGYVPQSEVVVTEAGEIFEMEFGMWLPPAATEQDEEIAEGPWVVTDRAGAEAVLGRPIPVVQDLWIETFARPSAGSRPRVRVAQLADSGDRITLVVSRSGPAPPVASPRVTALRVIPPTEAYPITTGTASFGGLMVTAKAALPSDSLRVLLQRLVEADGG